MNDETGPLAGLLVLDMTRVIAGPLSGQILGDLGAEVIKVERKGEGDDVRRVGPPWMKDAEGHDTKESTYFSSVNRNKRSIAVDFATSEGAQVLRNLAAKADILVENYRPGTLAKYGLDYETLRELNPGLVYCSVTGFGQTGPYATRSGYDYLVQGMSGLMSVTGMPDGVPTRVGVPVVDIFAGMNAVIGVQAALLNRARTGKGQAIDISLFDSQTALMLNTASAWLNAKTALGRTGNDHPSAAPYGVFEAADGYLIIATFSDREFNRLADVLGHPEWKEDPRFSTNAARVKHRAEMKAAVGEIVRHKTRAEWVAILNAATVSSGPINDMSDVEHDPQVLAREMIIELPDEHGLPVRMMGSPFRFSDTPVTYRRAPPAMGSHTDEVLRSVLDMPQSELDRLRESGAI
ncbi:MAG: CoA transferase [Alphaproteobacteria bacterium]|nr:CoA transferase [Alphaproteobacteria bacterium]